jgi:hypothetical protein
VAPFLEIGNYRENGAGRISYRSSTGNDRTVKSALYVGLLFGS